MSAMQRQGDNEQTGGRMKLTWLAALSREPEEHFQARRRLSLPWQDRAGGNVLSGPVTAREATLNFMRPPVCSIVPLPLHCGHTPGASM